MSKKRLAVNHVENRTIKIVEEVRAFEEFRTQVAPQLRADLQSGMSAKELYSKYEALAAARGLTIAMTDRNPAIALKAIQDILDRGQGKAAQEVRHKHKFQDLPEEQLDAILLSKLKNAGGDLAQYEHVDDEASPESEDEDVSGEADLGAADEAKRSSEDS